jgi:hypothetical protein
MWFTEDARPLHVQNENDSPSTRCCLPQRLSCLSTHWNGGRDSSVGTATRYELDGLGIESRWMRIFRTRPDRPWGPHSLLYSGYWVSFLEVKRPGRGANHPPTSSAEVKERVELYLYSPSGTSRLILVELYVFILFLFAISSVGVY